MCVVPKKVDGPADRTLVCTYYVVSQSSVRMQHYCRQSPVGMYLGLSPHCLVSVISAVGTEHFKLACQVAVGTTQVTVGVTKAFCRTLSIAKLLLQLQHLFHRRIRMHAVQNRQLQVACERSLSGHRTSISYCKRVPVVCLIHKAGRVHNKQCNNTCAMLTCSTCASLSLATFL